MERRDLERRQGRRRIAARATTHLSPEQRAFDPMAEGRKSRRQRFIVFCLAVLASLAVHFVTVGGSIGWHLLSPGAPEREEVKIEVRERPAEVKPEPPPPPPPPPVEKPVEKPKVARAVPPPESPPVKEPPKAKPVRVVGLSLESTNGVGEGDGPSFAVGNTRMGDTEKKAVAPETVPPPAVAAPPVAAPSGPAATNQVASRIPVAGVKYGMPKRLNPKKPLYPPTLKSQGVESEVTVMVSISAAGKVTAVKLIRESPYPEFNEVARAQALAEDFEPATRDGVPIPYSLSFTYRFRLEDE